MRCQVLCIVLSLAAISCGLKFHPDNIQWAKSNNIKFHVLEVSEKVWDQIVKNYQGEIDPESACLFISPEKIIARQGDFVYRYETNAFGHRIPIRMTYKEYCLNHEVGHIREFREQVCFHCKYAWP